MQDFLKKPIVSYIGAIIAFFALLSGVFGWWPGPDIAWSIAGILGFGSIASLRAFIDSNGWKTYALTFPAIILNALLLFGVIDLETMQAIDVVIAPLLPATLQAAASKVPKG